MDDLLDWSWFRGLSFYEFAIKFYESNHYRPTFEALQYLIYTLVGTDPSRFILINKIYNIIISIFIYYFTSDITKNRILAFITSSFYITSHLAYYQISQGIGGIESTALFLSIIILYLCIKLVDNENKNTCKSYRYNIITIIIIYILFFLLVFDHERYLSMASIIIITILLLKKPNDNELLNDDLNGHNKYNLKTFKVISIISFLIEIIIICYIRYLATNRVLPAGTGGTYVEETFNIGECLKHCINQVAIIFGINIGPEHLYGIEFSAITNKKIILLTFASILIILFIIITYISFRIYNHKKEKDLKKLLSIDLLFLTYIAMCIGSSSVTIRVEMRFVYSSFIVSVIYLSYMLKYIISKINLNSLKVIFTFLFIIIFMLRLPVEKLYREYYYKIYCFIDLKRVNSLYDLTIGTYGLDKIISKDENIKKKIIIVNKFYKMTNFYSEYFFKIYDKDNIGNKIMLVNDFSEIDERTLDENTIIIYEDPFNNTYVTYTF